MPEFETTVANGSGLSAGTKVGVYRGTFEGEANTIVAPAGLALVSGTEDARTITPVSNSAPLPVSDAGGSLTVDGTVAVTNGGTFVVQENGAALTALQLIDNLPVAQGSTTSGQSGVLAQGAVTTSAPSYTNGQTSPVSLDTTGSLRVAITSGAGSGGTALADRTGTFTPGSTSFTPIGGYVDDSASDALAEGNPGAVRMTTARAMHQNLAQVAGSTVATGNGTAAGSIRVTLPTDGTGVLATVTNVATIGTSVTPGTSAAHLGKAIDSPVGGTDTGVASLFRRVDTPATITPAVNDYAEGRVDGQGRQYVQASGGAPTGTTTSVADTSISTTLLAANQARKGWIIFNDSTITLRIKLGATASATSFTYLLQAQEYKEQIGPCYTGVIDGIWASDGAGSARITELT